MNSESASRHFRQQHSTIEHLNIRKHVDLLYPTKSKKFRQIFVEWKLCRPLNQSDEARQWTRRYFPHNLPYPQSEFFFHFSSFSSLHWCCKRTATVASHWWHWSPDFIYSIWPPLSHSQTRTTTTTVWQAAIVTRHTELTWENFQMTRGLLCDSRTS